MGPLFWGGGLAGDFLDTASSFLSDSSSPFSVPI